MAARFTAARQRAAAWRGASGRAADGRAAPHVTTSLRIGCLTARDVRLEFKGTVLALPPAGWELRAFVGSGKELGQAMLYGAGRRRGGSGLLALLLYGAYDGRLAALPSASEGARASRISDGGVWYPGKRLPGASVFRANSERQGWYFGKYTPGAVAARAAAKKEKAARGSTVATPRATAVEKSTALTEDTSEPPSVLPAVEVDLSALPPMDGSYKCVAIAPDSGDPDAFFSAMGIGYLKKKLLRTARYGVGFQAVSWVLDREAKTLEHRVDVDSPVKKVSSSVTLPLTGKEAIMPSPEGELLMRFGGVDETGLLLFDTTNTVTGAKVQMCMGMVGEDEALVTQTLPSGLSFKRLFARVGGPEKAADGDGDGSPTALTEDTSEPPSVLPSAAAEEEEDEDEEATGEEATQAVTPAAESAACEASASSEEAVAQPLPPASRPSSSSSPPIGKHSGGKLPKRASPAKQGWYPGKYMGVPRRLPLAEAPEGPGQEPPAR